MIPRNKKRKLNFFEENQATQQGATNNTAQPNNDMNEILGENIEDMNKILSRPFISDADRQTMINQANTNQNITNNNNNNDTNDTVAMDIENAGEPQPMTFFNTTNNVNNSEQEESQMPEDDVKDEPSLTYRQGDKK